VPTRRRDDRRPPEGVWIGPHPERRQTSVVSDPPVPTVRDLWGLVEQKAAKRHPTDPDALMVRGCAQVMLGETAAAAHSFQQAVAVRPKAEPAATYLRTGSLSDWVSEAAIMRDQRGGAGSR
jgi:hypothetical protein